MSEPSRVRGLARRLLTATAVGLVVAVTAYLCIFNGHRGSWDAYLPGWYVQHRLDEIEKAIEKHRLDAGRLPETLAELVPPKGEQAGWVRGDGTIADAWANAYHYRVQGDGYELFSLGRDGRPGGSGLDADIYPSSTGRPRELPTLRQFAFELETKGVLLLCVLTGACMAIVCLLPSREQTPLKRVGVIAATAVGSVFAAIVISVVHVPSGH